MKAYGVADPRYPHDSDRQVRIWVARFPCGHFLSLTAITATGKGYREAIDGNGRRECAIYQIDTVPWRASSQARLTALRGRAARDAVALVAAYCAGDAPGVRAILATWER